MFKLSKKSPYYDTVPFTINNFCCFINPTMKMYISWLCRYLINTLYHHPYIHRTCIPAGRVGTGTDWHIPTFYGVLNGEHVWGIPEKTRHVAGPILRKKFYNACSIMQFYEVSEPTVTQAAGVRSPAETWFSVCFIRGLSKQLNLHLGSLHQKIKVRAV